MFKVFIDNRERSLIQIFVENGVSHETKNLDLGDILILDATNDVVVAIIERKSLRDLKASISDGRYKEQKQRLLKNFNLKNILYIIEDYHSFSKLNDKSLESSIIHNIFRDEIKTLFSADIKDTYNIILALLDRIIKHPEYFIVSPDSLDKKEECSYFQMPSSSMKKAVSFENVQKQMLCQIPAISSKAAQSLYDEFKSIHKMLKYFQDKDQIYIREHLNKLKVNDRKISKRIVENLITYIFIHT